jgi:hypothetical protein
VDRERLSCVDCGDGSLRLPGGEMEGVEERIGMGWATLRTYSYGRGAGPKRWARSIDKAQEEESNRSSRRLGGVRYTSRV